MNTVKRWQVEAPSSAASLTRIADPKPSPPPLPPPLDLWKTTSHVSREYHANTLPSFRLGTAGDTSRCPLALISWSIGRRGNCELAPGKLEHVDCRPTSDHTWKEIYDQKLANGCQRFSRASVSVERRRGVLRGLMQNSRTEASVLQYEFPLVIGRNDWTRIYKNIPPSKATRTKTNSIGSTVI